MYSFSYLEPVCCSMSNSNCCLLTCIQVSQETGKVVYYSHLFKNLPKFGVIYTVKGFGVVNKAGIDVFLEFSCFFDPFCASSPFLSSTISLLEPLNSYVWVWISYTWRHSTRSHFCTASFSKTLRCIQAAVCVGSSFLSVLIAVLLDGCATICVSISLLRSTWVVFSFWLLWLKLLWLFLYKSVFI